MLAVRLDQRSVKWTGEIEFLGDPKILVSTRLDIKGTRTAVEFLMELMADGSSHEQILSNYPHLAEEDARPRPSLRDRDGEAGARLPVAGLTHAEASG